MTFVPLCCCIALVLSVDPLTQLESPLVWIGVARESNSHQCTPDHLRNSNSVLAVNCVLCGLDCHHSVYLCDLLVRGCPMVEKPYSEHNFMRKKYFINTCICFEGDINMVEVEEVWPISWTLTYRGTGDKPLNELNENRCHVYLEGSSKHHNLAPPFHVHGALHLKRSEKHK